MIIDVDEYYMMQYQSYMPIKRKKRRSYWGVNVRFFFSQFRLYTFYVLSFPVSTPFLGCDRTELSKTILSFFIVELPFPFRMLLHISAFDACTILSSFISDRLA
jgi:hypothetical protein